MVSHTIQCDILKILKPYKQRVESALQDKIDQFGSKSKLSQACAYSLMTGGKRIRPALVMMIAEALGNGANVVEAALSVEFFHTASLIADDLPCMDNDDMRRDKPSLHKVYGEAVSLLSSYALIAAGYEGLVKNKSKSPHINMLVVENVTQNAGINGAPLGQLLDIQPPDLSLKTVMKVMEKKTVTLFEIAFVCGWLLGGGSEMLLDKVKKAAWHFGMAFQIADDLSDQSQDITNGRKINLATICGKEEALQLFHKEKQGLLQLLEELNLNQGDLKVLVSSLL